MINGAEFNRNVSQHTLEELRPYFEQHVVWSLDGKRVLAHAPDLDGLIKEVERMGLTEYVFGFVPDPALSYLGGADD